MSVSVNPEVWCAISQTEVDVGTVGWCLTCKFDLGSGTKVEPTYEQKKVVKCYFLKKKKKKKKNDVSINKKLSIRSKHCLSRTRSKLDCLDYCFCSRCTLIAYYELLLFIFWLRNSECWCSLHCGRYLHIFFRFKRNFFGRCISTPYLP